MQQGLLLAKQKRKSPSAEKQNKEAGSLRSSEGKKKRGKKGVNPRTRGGGPKVNKCSKKKEKIHVNGPWKK